MRLIIALMLLVLLGAGAIFTLTTRRLEQGPRITVRYVPGSWHTISQTTSPADSAANPAQPLDLNPRHPQSTRVPSVGGVNTGDFQKAVSKDTIEDNEQAAGRDLPLEAHVD
jgi:hypothetical protein